MSPGKTDRSKVGCGARIPLWDELPWPIWRVLLGGSVSLGVAGVVELNRGHLFFFMDYLMNRSDEEAWASWRSVLAFMDQRMRRGHEFKVAHFEPVRCAQKKEV